MFVGQMSDTPHGLVPPRMHQFFLIVPPVPVRTASGKVAKTQHCESGVGKSSAPNIYVRCLIMCVLNPHVV